MSIPSFSTTLIYTIRQHSFIGVGHQQNANTTASGSPPLTAQPSPLTPEEQHRELDELVSDMMLTVQSIPDVKPHHQNNNSNFGLENARFIDDDEDRNIPYHARQDSRPFSYGVNSNMIHVSYNFFIFKFNA